MTPAEIKSLSKYLSYVLRHNPDAAGIVLDPAGWVAIDALLAGATWHGGEFGRAALDEVVRTNEKQRFTVSADGQRIRAAQGHSVEVDLGLEPTAPPETLFHGTAERNLTPILAEGLKPGDRRHVHLSPDTTTARAVGQRHGRPVILLVAAGRAHMEGQPFWQADNGVWLTDPLAPGYLSPLDGAP